VTVRVEPLEPAALVALVNDWASVPRAVGHRPPPPGAAPDATGSRTVALDATATADRLYAVFTAPDPAARAHRVTELLAACSVRPELAAADAGLVAAWSVPDPGHVLLAAGALALRAHLAAHPDRLGTCADDQCADVYVDASPAGHRRFCSLTCQNRARAAAFRARRRTASR
jgi:predicted RNA-binding Zn ribbon-like protein